MSRLNNPSAGGQTLYEAIVAPSGGDYTSLEDALADGKDTIFIRNGTYTISSDIDIPRNNVTIIGENKFDTILDFNNNVHLDTNLKTGISISNLKIKDGNGTGSLRINSNGSIFIDNCFFDPNNIGIYVNASGALITITRCVFDSSIGILLVSCGNTYISFCDFVRSKLNTSGTPTYVVITNCSLGLNDALSMAGDNNIITNNSFGHIANNDTGRLLMNGDNNIIAHNQFLRTNAGSIDAVRVSGSNNLIEGNYIESIGTAYRDGIVLTTGDNNIVKGNYVNSSSQYGINISGSGAVDNLIEGNYLLGNTTAPINDAGVGTNIRNNYPTDIIQDEKRFIQMKNTSGGQLDQGDVVTIKAVAAGNEITTTTAQGDDLVFGMVDETIADNGTGRVQIQGKTVVLKVDGTTDIAIGDFIGTFTTAKIGMKAAAGDMAIAIALEAYTTDDSSGIIDALLISPRKI